LNFSEKGLQKPLANRLRTKQRGSRKPVRVGKKNIEMEKLLLKKFTGKFLIPFLAAVLFATGTNAQVAAYSFSQSNGTYTPITGGTVLVTALTADPVGNDSMAMDDYTYVNRPLAFPFTINGTSYTAFNVNSNGWISFGSTSTSSASTPISSSSAFGNVVSAFANDLQGQFHAVGDVTTGSPVITNVSNTSYCKVGALFKAGSNFPATTTIVSFTANSITVSDPATATAAATQCNWALAEIRAEALGIAPNRTFVIQFSGLTEYGVANTYTDFQIQLNEGGGIAANQTISIVYGTVYRVASTETIQVGLRGTSNTDYNNRTTTTNWAATTAGSSNSANATWSTTSFPGTGLTFTWSPPLPCVAPVAQPTNLILTPGASVANISFTAATPAADKYLVVRSTAATLSANPVNGTTYALNATLGGGTVVGNSSATSLITTGLSANTTYYFTVFAFNDICSGGPAYNVTSPLTGNVATTGVQAYTWNVTTGTGDATVSSNWTPVRNVADPTDTLYFNNGGNSTISNLQTSSVAKIVVQNNTTIIATSAATAIITIGKQLLIEAGSSLSLSGTNGLSIAFSSTSAPQTSTIAGTLNLSGTGTSSYSATNTVTTITPTGVVSTTNNGAITGAIPSLVFQAGSVYNHNRNGGTIPTANYSAASTINVTGITSTGLSPVAKMGSVTWNCPAQTVINSWSSTVDTIYGNLTIANTGTGSVEGGNSPDIQVMGNFTQTGGTFAVGNYTSGNNFVEVFGSVNLNGGTLLLNSNTGGTATYQFRVNQNFNQLAGHTISRSNTVSATVNSIVFGGSASLPVNVAGIVTNNISYILNNPAGAVLTGILPVNADAINMITNGSWSGTGSFQYNSVSSNLTYNGTGAQTATIFEFPASNGPVSLTINKTAGTVVTLPFNRTIAGTLTLTSGDINLGVYNLQIGTSASTSGSISGTGGFVRVTTGSLTRWFGTTGLPTTAGTGIGYFPVAASTSSRVASVYFDAATSLTSGGTITLSHNDASSVTTGLSIADGAYTINNRTDASWVFSTGNGIALGATNSIGVRITAANIFGTSNVANLRVMQANTVVGTHVAGTGTAPNYQASRSGLTFADLAFPYYVGASAADMNLLYTAILTGNWNSPTTWNLNSVPSISDFTTINSGVNVTIGSGTNAAKSIVINSGATLTSNANLLTVDSAIANNGTLNIGGGSVIINGGVGANGIINATGSVFNLTSGNMTIGPAGGGNKRFTTNGGTSTVSGGNLVVNGNFVANGGSFNQTGGIITIDGNSGTAATSVGSGTHHVLVTTPGTTHNFSAGTLILVDPPHSSYAASSTRSVSVSSNSTSSIFSGLHTIQLGDGLSTTPGNVDGFVVETYASSVTPINHLVINGGGTTGRWGSGSYGNSTSFGTHIKGNLTINTGSEFRTAPVAANSIAMAIGGNIINDGVFTSMAASAITMGSMTGFTTTTQQTISGSGLFRNNSTGSNANFRSITTNNTGGLSMTSIGDVSYSGTLTFTLGKVFMGNNTMIQIAGAAISGNASGTGWVVGKFQKNATGGAISHTYPVGDANYYTPVVITGAAGSVLTPGDIIVSTVTGDHPAIGYAQLNPAKSVNRYFTVQTANGITFNPGSLSMTLNWNAADVDAGATTSNFVSAQNTGGNNWVNNTVSTPAATSIQVTGLGASINGSFQVAEFMGIPLGIKLENIAAVNIGKKNRIDWSAISEASGDYFELERSEEGIHFTKLAVVSAKGSESNYSYWDESPLNGINYYRLKMIGLNGGSSYSKTVSAKVNTGAAATVTVYPNPVRDVVTVKVTGGTENGNISLVDLSGRTLRSMTVSAAETAIDMSSLPPGIYFIKYADKNLMETIKINKQ
jgi:hypothetical protein